jgi:ferric-dicitrate binding protein FerR (iron transport regulator)
MLNQAKEILLQLSLQKELSSSEEIDRMFQKTWSHIQEKSTNMPIKTKQLKKIRTKRWLQPWQIAASILFVMFGTWLSYNHFSQSEQIYTTNFGETKTILLPDQSEVVLQANSTLRTAKKWKTTEVRSVWLEGEAFFKVRKGIEGEAAKFIVGTDNFKVQVLGTQFNVLHRRNHKRVILQEGKVKVQLENDKEIDIQPNEMIRLYKNDTYQKEQVKAAVHTAWAEKKLILNETPLKEIARIFEENYGYKVHFGSEVNQNITRSSLGGASFSNLEDLILIVENSYDIQITTADKQLIFD